MRYKKNLSIFLIFLLLISTSTPLFARENTRREHPRQIENRDVFIKRVIDGDTIQLKSGHRVRLIGIDAPERKARFGQPAKRFLQSLIEDKPVRLVFDTNRTDRHGRVLAYVYKNNTLINEQIVLNGFARILPIPPNTAHATTFEAAEQVARAGNLGIWSLDRPTPSNERRSRDTKTPNAETPPQRKTPNRR